MKVKSETRKAQLSEPTTKVMLSWRRKYIMNSINVYKKVGSRVFIAFCSTSNLKLKETAIEAHQNNSVSRPTREKSP